MVSLSREEWEKQSNKKILETRRSVNDLVIHELYEPMYGAGKAKVGSFKRKAKGQEYMSPRILLRSYFKKHIGKECRVLEGKASMGDIPMLQNRDVLIIILRVPKEPMGTF